MNMDKNGKEIKTGHIVKIEGGFFKADNGTFLVKHAPGDPSWSGSDYSLRKCNKKGVESEAKYSTAFWPLMVTVNSREKYYAAKQHNKEHATIEIIGSVKVYELNLKERRGWNDYESKRIVTEKEYQELLACKYTEIEIISESTTEQKTELPVPVLAEEIAPIEVVEEIDEQREQLINQVLAGPDYISFNGDINELTNAELENIIERTNICIAEQIISTTIINEYAIITTGNGTFKYKHIIDRDFPEIDYTNEVKQDYKEQGLNNFTPYAEEPTPSIEAVEAIAPTTTIQSTNLINEQLAKRSKENMSFSDYKTGSATAEFNQEIAGVRSAIEKAKTKVSEEAQAKLNRLLASHTARYASWTNRRNANGAGHVSVMLAGPSNYNMSKHNKYLAKEGKLWAEYDEFKGIYNRIDSIVAGDKIIKSNDANAIDKLKEKLAKALEEHAGYKAYNAQARKDGTQPHMPYVMSNSNGRIKGIKDRIAHLERLAAQETKEIVVETVSNDNGIRIVDNVEAHRLQIFFNGKPSAEIRTQLKKNGFRWAPSISAWQSYRSDHATRAAKEIISAI